MDRFIGEIFQKIRRMGGIIERLMMLKPPVGKLRELKFVDDESAGAWMATCWKYPRRLRFDAI